MEKTRQRQLIAWLKQQSKPIKRHLHLLMGLGLLSSLLIITQAWLLADLLQGLIIDQLPRDAMAVTFGLLLATVCFRAALIGLREKIGFRCGMLIRQVIRRQVLDKLQQLGPTWIQGKPAGSWATLILEQIEEMQDYYARYLPQMSLAIVTPITIVIALFPVNWAAGLILLITAPLVPLFMVLVGMGAADANRRHFVALARLGGYFHDRLRGMETLRLFDGAETATQQMFDATEKFRQRTMAVLKLAFLSSAVLEFFVSISIALIAVYFGFSYLGAFNFGHYGLAVTLGSGFLALLLAPEFFQPLRDLGTFYHAKAQAIGAAEALLTFLDTDSVDIGQGEQPFVSQKAVTLCAQDLCIFSLDGKQLVGPLNFHITAKQRVAIVGQSGAGKSSLLNVILGFLPYQGSLQINGVELNALNADDWRQHLSWIGQNPYLPEQTLRDNLLLGAPAASAEQLQQVLTQAHVAEFLPLLPLGLETPIGDGATRLSVGQAQRIAIARALLRQPDLLLLDEPTASLDATSERYIMQTLIPFTHQQTTLLVTHRLEEIRDYDLILVVSAGQIIQSGSYSNLIEQQEGAFAKLFSDRVQRR